MITGVRANSFSAIQIYTLEANDERRDIVTNMRCKDDENEGMLQDEDNEIGDGSS